MKKEADRIIQQIKTKNTGFWQRVKNKQALNLFHLADKHVSAYQDFLRKYKIKIGNVKTVADFQLLPIMNKKN